MEAKCQECKKIIEKIGNRKYCSYKCKIKKYYIPIKCSCGCGKIISKYDNLSRKRKYVLGHHKKNKKVSLKTIKKLRLIGKKRYLCGKCPKNIGGKGKNNPMSNPIYVKKAINKRIHGYKIGRIKPPMLGKKHSKKTKLLLSKINRGMVSPMKGKKRSKASIKKMINTKKEKYNKGLLKGYWLNKKRSKDTKKKISIKLKRLYRENKIKGVFKIGRKPDKVSIEKSRLAHIGSKWTINQRKKFIKTTKRLWSNKKFKEKRIRELMSGLNLKPNKPEKILIKLIEKNKLPYKYVGNRKLIIDGKNPDFINSNGQKKIIELFGDYWHGKKSNIPKNRTIKGTIDHYKRCGYNVLIIWEKELNNLKEVVNTIKKFEEVNYDNYKNI